MMKIEEIKEIVNKVDGYLTEREGKFLYHTAKNCKGKGVIVEIGSWKGRSTILLGLGSKAGNKPKIYAIDPHIGSSEHQKVNGKVWTFEEFKKNIEDAKVDDIITPIVKTSQEAIEEVNEMVEFVFIDGAHEYELVKLDFELWFPKLIENGIIAFHDSIGNIGCLGPKRVVAEYMYKSKNFRNIGFVDTITFGQKVKQNSIKDRLKNQYILLLRNLYEFGCKLPLPKSIKTTGKKLLNEKVLPIFIKERGD